MAGNRLRLKNLIRRGNIMTICFRSFRSHFVCALLGFGIFGDQFLQPKIEIRCCFEVESNRMRLNV